PARRPPSTARPATLSLLIPSHGSCTTFPSTTLFRSRVRAASALPLALGFGISTPEQAVAVAHLAEGVVVGSALVERLAREGPARSEEHTSELQSRENLVCRLLLEKKKVSWSA